LRYQTPSGISRRVAERTPPIVPETPPTLHQAAHMVARLGGFLGRKSDGEPGAQALWIGIQRLDDITNMYRVFATPPPQAP
ncbi:MAG: IS4 family transposase, partial [Candidatus Accumulibacter sp.]|uniref:IS4 family transposase n=1 Tax=Accumulibacter sp. TaxID=2053492 RepID=UPI0028789EDD